ncbi:FecR family protein [Sphingobacterium lactis]|uniref:FecR family protein n=1 Tax=Sphingobacterium lactis TaxID=797291 RepID=UPI003EC8C7C0
MEKFDTDEPQFNSTDLIGNDSFMDAIKDPGSENAIYWNSIYQKYPQKRAVIDEARNLILNLNFKNDEIQQQYSSRIWDEIHRRTVPSKRKISYKTWYGIAASFLIIGFLSLYIFDPFHLTQIRIATAPGEIRTVELPDGSTVVLNGNSELSYNKNLGKDDTRKVYFEGDGNFSITKMNSRSGKQQDRKFLVMSGQSIVEVLGTEFRVHSRAEGTTVSLYSGLVSFAVNRKGSSDTESSLNRIILYPGDEVEYSKGENQIEKRTQAHEQTLQWEKDGVQFRGATLKQTMAYVRDIYGYDYILKDPTLLERRITGKFSNKDLEVFIKTIGSTLGMTIDIDKQKKVLTISAQ